jgi:ankyrin repeat protein
VKLLLDAGADVNTGGDGRYGSTLYVASESGHEAVVKTLLDAGADVNARGEEERYGSALRLHGSRG